MNAENWGCKSFVNSCGFETGIGLFFNQLQKVEFGEMFDILAIIFFFQCLTLSLWSSPPKIIVIFIYVLGVGMTRDELLEPSLKGQYIGELLF